MRLTKTGLVSLLVLRLIRAFFAGSYIAQRNVIKVQKKVKEVLCNKHLKAVVCLTKGEGSSHAFLVDSCTNSDYPGQNEEESMIPFDDIE